jgi:hypothetical protein
MMGNYLPLLISKEQRISCFMFPAFNKAHQRVDEIVLTQPENLKSNCYR